MPQLRIALAQLNVTVGDLEGNRERIEEAIDSARAWLADVVVFPELAVCGYPPEDLLLKPQFIEANRRVLQRLQGAARGIVACVGFVDRDRQGRLYNAAAVLAAGRIQATYRKQCLPNYGVFDERRYFTAGAASAICLIGGVRVGLSICEDLWEERPSRRAALLGAQALINLSASPYHAGKLKERERLFALRARANRLAIAYCNLVGGQDELVFDGASFVLDRAGRRLAQGPQFREGVVLVDVLSSQLGPSAPLRTESRAGTRAVINLPHRLAPRPALARAPERVLPPLAEIYEALTLGVRDYVRKNGFSTVVLGISGGIDSALTACVASDALGPAHVMGISMPSRFSSEQTQADAKRLGRALGIELHEIPIEPIFRAYLETLSPLFGSRPPDTTEQNLQARIRGTVLMALSNKFGWLVLTTGNKSEIATGYTTLYGDMAGGFAVIKDVPKTLVYQLASYRNMSGGGSPIPPGILERAPTAELAEHQTDQDTLPPYDLLDRILKAYIEEDRSLGEIVRRSRSDEATVRRVLRMADRSEYKRRQGPPGVKITPKAFGRDRRIPITNQYQEG